MMPLFWLSLSFLGGIIASTWMAIPIAGWLALALICLAALLLRWRCPNLRIWCASASLWQRFVPHRFTLRLPLPLAVLGLAFCFGGWRYQQSISIPTNPPDLSSFANQGEISLEGVVVDDPDRRDTYTALIVKAQRLWLPGEQNARHVSGKTLARLPPYADWRYGDRLRLDGVLETPPTFEDFSYQEYLARQKIYAYIPRARGVLLARQEGSFLLSLIYRLRHHSLEILAHIFPEPQASLLAGILLGIESGIPQWLEDAFVNSGTAHIIAISGFNITILSGLFMSLWGRMLGRWRGALLAALCIGVYTILVGANASVVRAAVMGGLSLFAAQLGRRQSGINSLAFIAALMAAFHPAVLWDVSFQLSFAATLGLVLYASPLSERLSTWLERYLPTETAQRFSALSSEWLLFTLAAQFTTLPVILYHFQRLSLSTLIANPLILPVQPAVMLLGGSALIGGLIYLPLGNFLALLATPFLTYTIRIVERMGNIPFGSWRVQPLSLFWVIAFYLALLGATASWNWLRPRLNPLKPALALGGLLISVTWIWQSVIYAPDGRLHLILLDVNKSFRSGEAILIQTPAGRYLLINGGPSASNLNSALDEWMPITWRQIDWLVVTGAQENQIAALPAFIERGEVKQVWWAIPSGKSAPATALQDALKRQRTSIVFAEPAQALDLGEGIRLEILNLNGRGAALLLEWDRFRAFLPVGLDTTGRDELLQSGKLSPVSVWLLSDRGSSWLNPLSFLHRLQPQVILLSVAAGDWSGLPHIETLQRLEGQNLLRTDLNGWVHIQTDGQQMWVEAEKPPP
jgi:competence protein ComEC